MRHYPDMKDEYTADDVRRLAPEQWQLDALKLNPGYMGWGPHEDYMIQRPGEDHGWASNVVKATWAERSLEPDGLNHVVNFYFEIDRKSEPCGTCGGSGVHPEGQWIDGSFYRHSSPFIEETATDRILKRGLDDRFGIKMTETVLPRGVMPPVELLEKYGQPFHEFCVRTMEHGGYWCDDITEDEAAELVKEKRGKGAAADFNEQNRPGRGGGIGHDAINRSILVRRRCERLGVPLECETCEGHGYLYADEKPRLTLVLWVIHPRKGAQRAWTIDEIKRDELPEVVEFLREAKRNNDKLWKAVPA